MADKMDGVHIFSHACECLFSHCIRLPSMSILPNFLLKSYLKTPHSMGKVSRKEIGGKDFRLRKFDLNDRYTFFHSLMFSSSATKSMNWRYMLALCGSLKKRFSFFSLRLGWVRPAVTIVYNNYTSGFGYSIRMGRSIITKKSNGGGVLYVVTNATAHGRRESARAPG